MPKISEKQSIFIQHTELNGEFESKIGIGSNKEISLSIKFLLMPKKEVGLGMIIGTDILMNFELLYNYPKNKFTLKSK